MIHARIARFDRLKVEFNWWQATFTRSMNNDMRGHAMTATSRQVVYENATS
ncbi:hypothetical protein ACN3XK_06990 [Actinomadura welshii]